MTNTDYPSRINKWEMFEVQIEGTAEGNPFVEQRVNAIFSNQMESKVVEGFYDGKGIYKVRFMPTFEGKHTFSIRATFMNGSVSGAFYVDPAKETNKGPVRTASTYHFAYENGETYNSVGTTAYVWTWQSDETIAETIESLKKARFNKIRFCIFPKHYVYNFHEPSSYPYEGTPMDSSVITEENFMSFWGKTNGSEFDHYRFNPAHFAKLEKCIAALGEAGIEADLILFHPYDRWGFSCMTREENDFYLSYVVRRLSAYHNVWWAMANEWDLIPSKSLEDWEHYGNLVAKLDSYHHLRSIHNCRQMYDHSRPWITHASVQRVDIYKGAKLTDEYRIRYGKPVVMDEIAYEGNIPLGWGNITGEEMIRRFWETAVRGGYPGHGETFLNDNGILWWSHGGQLHGESWKRVGFLLDIMNEVPGSGIACLPMEWDSVTGVPEDEWTSAVKSQYIFYYTFMRPSSRTFHIDDETAFAVDVIDTWDMTITDAGVHKGTFTIELPQKQYMAVRLRKVDETAAEIVSEPEETAEETTEPEVVPAEEIVEIEETTAEEVTVEDVTAEESVPESEDVTEEETEEASETFELPSEPEVSEEESVERGPATEDTEILDVVEESEPEEPENKVEIEAVEADEDEDTDFYSIPEMMNTLKALSEIDPVSEENDQNSDTDVDLTLKLDEIINEEPAEEKDEEFAETAGPEVSGEEEDDDDIFDLIETEADIENTIHQLRLSQTASIPVVNEDTAEQTTGYTAELREAMDNMVLTGENDFDLDDVLETSEEPAEEDAELPDLITGRFPIISELTHKVFRSKK